MEEIYNEVDKIKGWFTKGECSVLFPYIQNLPENGILVELGTYLGRSTRFFRLTNPNIKILTIDIATQYDVKETIPPHLDESVLSQGNIFQVLGDCQKIVRTFNWQVDCLFIDTRHTFEDTLKNLEDWSKFVKKGGIIVLHDYHSGFPGVQEAVKKFLENTDEYKLVEFGGIGIALLQK